METQDISQLVRFSDEKMQKIPVFGSEKYFFDLYCLRSGQDQRVHAHPESDKIYFVLRGTGRFHIGEQEQDLGPGQTVVARPNQLHGVKNISADDLVLLVFMSPRP
jgi:quercetin dioxygenase-like cupin family protein